LKKGLKMSANDKQVGGSHYKSSIQHWDYVVANDLDYFQAQITKYVTRWKKKNGLVDLEKGLHFLEKYIEIAKSKEAEQPLGFIAQPFTYAASTLKPDVNIGPVSLNAVDHKAVARVLGEFSGSNGITAADLGKERAPEQRKATWYSSDKIPPRDAEGAADRNYVNQDR
jgi:hypothetical protein